MKVQITDLASPGSIYFLDPRSIAPRWSVPDEDESWEPRAVLHPDSATPEVVALLEAEPFPDLAAGHSSWLP